MIRATGGENFARFGREYVARKDAKATERKKQIMDNHTQLREKYGQLLETIQTVKASGAPVLEDMEKLAMGTAITLTRQAAELGLPEFDYRIPLAQSLETLTPDKAAAIKGGASAIENQAAAVGAQNLGTPGVLGQNQSQQEAAQLQADADAGLPEKRAQGEARQDIEETRLKANSDYGFNLGAIDAQTKVNLTENLYNGLVRFMESDGEKLTPEETQQFKRELSGMPSDEIATTSFNFALLSVPGLYEKLQKGGTPTPEETEAVLGVLTKISGTRATTIFGGMLQGLQDGGLFTPGGGGAGSTETWSEEDEAELNRLRGGSTSR